MKIHGWCERCHKVRRVEVSGAGVALVAAGGVATGVCDECQDEEDEKRRRRGKRVRP